MLSEYSSELIELRPVPSIRLDSWEGYSSVSPHPLSHQNPPPMSYNRRWCTGRLTDIPLANKDIADWWSQPWEAKAFIHDSGAPILQNDVKRSSLQHERDGSVRAFSPRTQHREVLTPLDLCSQLRHCVNLFDRLLLQSTS